MQAPGCRQGVHCPAESAQCVAATAWPSWQAEAPETTTLHHAQCSVNARLNAHDQPAFCHTFFVHAGPLPDTAALTMRTNRRLRLIRTPSDPIPIELCGPGRGDCLSIRGRGGRGHGGRGRGGRGGRGGDDDHQSFRT